MISENPKSAFVICSFWMAQALARSGQVEEAKYILNQTLRAANHLGIHILNISLPGTTSSWETFTGILTCGIDQLSICREPSLVRCTLRKLSTIGLKFSYSYFFIPICKT